MSRIADYLKSEEKQLSEAAKQAGIIGHNATTGKNREDLLADFLRKHIPARLSLHSNARIFSLNNDESKEIDLLLINDISINFLNKLHMFTNIESVAAAITVKSHLDKTSLHDCLNNLASIPQMSTEVLEFLQPYSHERNSFIEQYPRLFVFAFSGSNGITIQNQVNAFYENHVEIPLNRRPKGIVVNGQYEIYHKAELSEKPQEKKHYDLEILSDRYRGFPLARMIGEIEKYVGWLSFMSINFHHYFNKQF